MDYIKKTIKTWNQYYKRSNPNLDSSNPYRATEVGTFLSYFLKFRVVKSASNESLATALHEGSRYEHHLQQGAYNGIYPLPAAWTLQKSINTSRSGKANSMKFKLLIPKERK